MASFSAFLNRKYITSKRKPLQKSQIDYGSLCEINYNGKDGVKKYNVLVLHPKLDGKILHCLDLDLIDERTFVKFYNENKEEEDGILYERLTKNKGLLKSNIRIGTSFYTAKVKNNKLLMKDRPYKTLELSKITSVKYIPYDEDGVVKSYQEQLKQNQINERQLNDNESTQL